MLILNIIVLLLAMVLTVAELRRDLMMLQQNSYRRERYMRWLRNSGDTSSYGRLIAYVLLLLSVSKFHLQTVAITLIGVYALVSAWRLITRKYKKPLVMTPRAKRIFAVSIVLTLLFCTAIILLSPGTLRSSVYMAAVAMLGAFCISHGIVLTANYVLQPVEKRINRKFYNAAADKLASMPGLKIIGITGSYGKTSTKHYLYRILSEHYDTLMTPGSYNTTLGVVRTINEMLKPYNEVFIVEMGAKNKGDIKEICDLVHPEIGIITAVGPQHLETFKTLDNVRDTKFELADALPSDGLAVINNDFQPSKDRQVSNTHSLRYGVSDTDGCNFTATDIVYSKNGTDFVITGGEEPLRLHTQLVGECNISNLIAAVIVARELGVPDEKIRYAVSKIEQVEHRLHMRHLPGGLTIIDDAFNSNPSGSRMALNVLSMMKPGKRIVITPGMIELGSMQYKLNEEFGRHMAKCADVAMIVGEYNKEAIASGLKEGGMAESNIMYFSTFLEANAKMLQISAPGDTVLIENDLPDTFK